MVLYISGGFCDGVALRSVERLVVAAGAGEGQWEALPSMRQGRIGHASVGHRGDTHL